MLHINRKSSERGAMIVEFAIVLPLLMLMLMGTIELGLLLYNKQVLTNASREGARTGVARFDANGDTVFNGVDIEAIVTQYCQQRLITFGVAGDPVTTPSGFGGAYGTVLTVTVDYDYKLLFSQLLKLGPVLHLKTETVMRMEDVIPP